MIGEFGPTNPVSHLLRRIFCKLTIHSTRRISISPRLLPGHSDPAHYTVIDFKHFALGTFYVEIADYVLKRIETPKHNLPYWLQMAPTLGSRS
jgi:hypothetical protein